MVDPVRCAIYTRKSTEEGLEQEFNSLDAQREACAAYILSQKHEGWSANADIYDDGGYSGGNMQRPGLVQLMADVSAGKVNVIVVYKVDRLTRSLADFARIVDVLDAAGASFVSVTQSFNTTTSMGRLTRPVRAGGDRRAYPRQDCSISRELNSRFYYNEQASIVCGYHAETVIPFSGSAALLTAEPRPDFNRAMLGIIQTTNVRVRTVTDGRCWDQIEEFMSEWLSEVRIAINGFGPQVIMFNLRLPDFVAPTVRRYFPPLRDRLRRSS